MKTTENHERNFFAMSLDENLKIQNFILNMIVLPMCCIILFVECIISIHIFNSAWLTKENLYKFLRLKSFNDMILSVTYFIKIFYHLTSFELINMSYLIVFTYIYGFIYMAHVFSSISNMLDFFITIERCYMFCHQQKKSKIYKAFNSSLMIGVCSLILCLICLPLAFKYRVEANILIKNNTVFSHTYRLALTRLGTTFINDLLMLILYLIKTICFITLSITSGIALYNISKRCVRLSFRIKFGKTPSEYRRSNENSIIEMENLDQPPPPSANRNGPIDKDDGSFNSLNPSSFTNFNTNNSENTKKSISLATNSYRQFSLLLSPPSAACASTVPRAQSPSLIVNLPNKTKTRQESLLLTDAKLLPMILLTVFFSVLRNILPLLSLVVSFYDQEVISFQLRVFFQNFIQFLIIFVRLFDILIHYNFNTNFKTILQQKISCLR